VFRWKKLLGLVEKMPEAKDYRPVRNLLLGKIKEYRGRGTKKSLPAS
jgi:hypothetical protein